MKIGKADSVQQYTQVNKYNVYIQPSVSQVQAYDGY